MTNEGQMGNPMDPVEVAHAMVGLAGATRAYFIELKQQGFTNDEAMRLTVAWIVGTAGGKAS